MRVPSSVLVLALLAASASADVVHLKGGGRLVGRVEDAGDKIRVVMPGGTMVVAKDNVESVETQDTPAQEFARRRAELKTGDAAAAVALAAVAGESGLAAERGELLELAAKWAPTDAKITAEVERWRIFERPLPSNPAAEAALAASVGKDAKIHLTAHWRIAYDTDFAVARRRGEMLEAAWRKFQSLATRAGLAARAFDDRLECVVFRDYQEWLKAADMPESEIGGMVGIFVWTNRRVLLYDTSTSPVAKEIDRAVAKEIKALDDARASLETQRGQIAEIEQALADGTAAKKMDEAHIADLRTWLVGARKDVAKDQDDVTTRAVELQKYRDDLARHFEIENVSSTTHEACHQIAFAFGVSRAGQPKWLIEGLATLFEAQSRTSFVLEAPNAPRLKDVRDAWARGEGGVLTHVLGDEIFQAKGREPVAYAESWSLTYYLASRRPREFARYLAEGELLGPVKAPGARVADFKRFFGDDLDAVEHDWRAYVERL